MTGPTLAIVSGLAIALAGLWRHRGVLRMPLASRGSSLPFACALRAVLVGGALALGGAGWAYDSTTVVGLACVIGLEELLETSVVVAALRAQARDAAASAVPDRA